MLWGVLNATTLAPPWQRQSQPAMLLEVQGGSHNMLETILGEASGWSFKLFCLFPQTFLKYRHGAGLRSVPVQPLESLTPFASEWVCFLVRHVSRGSHRHTEPRRRRRGECPAHGRGWPRPPPGLLPATSAVLQLPDSTGEYLDTSFKIPQNSVSSASGSRTGQHWPCHICLVPLPAVFCQETSSVGDYWFD